MKNLIVATKNKGKVAEIEDSLKELDYKILSLAASSGFPEIEETGSTFEDNARIKADRVFEHFKILTLADDSGLEVDSLGGAPGVYSARYSGADATDESNCEKLLQKLVKEKDKSRTARFKCVMVLKDSKTEKIFEGVCEGTIGNEKKGNDGFGYDPLFIPDGYDKTFAELDLKTKNSISHRGKALKLLKEYLLQN
jgi:XTP/dITP diphosphohydrolase